jgi:hypothetical protein
VIVRNSFVHAALALLLLSAALLAPAAAAAPPVAPVSSHAMLHACCTPDELAERIFAESKAMGAAYVRVDVELAGIFESGNGGLRPEPNWAPVDRIVELSRRHDLPVLGILLAPPAYLTTCPERGPEARLCPAEDTAEFGRLAGEVAQHARDTIRHWEIVNEPDGRWAFEGSAEQYAGMLSAAYEGIKARVPEATVVMGGVQSPHEPSWLERVFAAPGADAAHKFDVANVHLRGTVGAVVARYAEFRSRLAGHGFAGPLWVTEHGYPADPAFQSDPAYRGGDPSQAAYLTQSLVGLGEVGAEQVFVTLRDNLGGAYASEGVEHIEETAGYPVTRRPSFQAVRRLVDSWDQLMAWRAEQREQERLERAHGERLSLLRVELKISRKRLRSARLLHRHLLRRGRPERGEALVAEARAELGWRRAFAGLERARARMATLAAAELRSRIAG